MDNTHVSAKPRWGQARRLAFIDLRLQYDGRINRGDIQKFFDTSTPQATADLDLYKRIAEGNLRYDGRERAYMAEPDFHPQFGRSAATRYLDELYRLAGKLVDRDESFVGFVPETGVVATPSRAIDSSKVATLVRAIRDGVALDVLYQSMNVPDPVARTITPHAFGFDGLRWHVRAWCHGRETFRDFAIGRMTLHGAVPDADRVDPLTDEGWVTKVDIVLVPHPGLSPSQRQAVMWDYEMEDGEHRLECRKAMVFYTLRHLNLETDLIAADPARQHVIVKNRADVERWMSEDRPPSTSDPAFPVG